MKFRDLVSHFDRVELFPIPVDEVRDWLLENMYPDAIELYPFKLETPKKCILGAYHQYAQPVGVYGQNPEIIIRIHYAEDVEKNLQRLIIVKELMHIFDIPDHNISDTSDAGRISSREELLEAIPGILSSEVREAMDNIESVDNDKFGLLKACCVLIPPSKRSMLREKLSEETLTVEDIATFVGMPALYVDIWLNVDDRIVDYILDL